MKRVNLLSKAELKKVKGGDPGTGGLCVPTVYCMSPSNTLVREVPVPDCDTLTPHAACYRWDEDPSLIAPDLSYCAVC